MPSAATPLKPERQTKLDAKSSSFRLRVADRLKRSVAGVQGH